MLSSQTIGDLYDVILCSSNELLSEITREDETIGYNSDEIALHRGAVICIEDVAHGDGQSEEDYSESVLRLSHKHLFQRVLTCSLESSSSS